MIISQDELERRLNSPKNLANIHFVENRKPAKKLDSATKTVAAILSHTKDPELKDLDLSAGQIQQAKSSKKVQKNISAGLERIQELAIDKMMEALGLMTPEKFADASLKDLSAVTRDMSRVIENTREKRDGDSQLQIIIHAPSQKSEDSYLTVDV